MIYTLTLNPALDYIMYSDTFNVNTINRSYNEKLYSGGKGINVSVILKELGVKSVAMGFLAGFTGKYVEEDLKSKKIDSDFIFVPKGITRINVKIRSKEETDINASGPNIGSDEIGLMLSKISRFDKNDMIIISGSISKAMPTDIYEQILKVCERNEVKIVVDTSGKLLIDVLKYSPFLIKPNYEELCDMFGEQLDSEEKIMQSMAKAQNMGAQNILVSLGANGSILLDSDSVYHTIKAPFGKVVNTVGAGDSMLAGFLAGYIGANDFLYALKLATACGSATAFTEYLANKSSIISLLEKL